MSIQKFPLIALAAGLSFLAGSVHADGSGALADWTGAYAGGQIASFGGHDDWSLDGRYDLDDAAFGGAFAGYNMQSGPVVYGFEVSALAGKSHEADYPEFYYKNVIDLKGRVGYAAGNVLAYVSAGYSRASASEDGESFLMTGSNLGVGFDLALSSNVILGAEYVSRNLSGECPHDQELDGRVKTLAAKVAYRF